LVVYGLGPIGQFCVRIAKHLGVERVIAVDLVRERNQRGLESGAEIVEWKNSDDTVAEVRERTGGRGADAVIDAVGMEAHGAPVAETLGKVVGVMPGTVARPVMERMGIDRGASLYAAIDSVRRGGTVSIIGVYGGAATPMPLGDLFDRQIQIRMGQANVKRWVNDILPLLTDDSDPLGTENFATHRLPLNDAPRAYEMFQKKEDGAIKVVLKP
jgi:S-(hydroxymethyl)glutathione dehydrogenase/alcohol dehydrogenase